LFPESEQLFVLLVPRQPADMLIARVEFFPKWPSAETVEWDRVKRFHASRPRKKKRPRWKPRPQKLLEFFLLFQGFVAVRLTLSENIGHTQAN
jgi:hypothetical protein